MSCPHYTETERTIGDVTFLVCRDCGAKLASEPIVAEAEDDTLICGKLNRAKDAACGLAPEHEGRHDYTVDPGEDTAG